MLKDKKITLKSGLSGTIISVTADRIILNVNGTEKMLGTKTIINNGLLVDPDPEIVEEMKNIIDEDERIKSSKSTSAPVIVSTVKPTKRLKSSAKTISISSKLQFPNKYGTNARSIYEECVKSFNFDSSKIGRFGPQQELYSLNSTKEGYSVWFISHSNWTHDHGGKWKNMISGNLIDEYWDDATIERFESDDEKRVVFAKDKNNEYVFLGVYKCIGIDTKNKCKHYERIQDHYE